MILAQRMQTTTNAFASARRCSQEVGRRSLPVYVGEGDADRGAGWLFGLPPAPGDSLHALQTDVLARQTELCCSLFQAAGFWAGTRC